MKLYSFSAVALGLAASGAYAKKSRSYESRGYEEAPRRQRRPLGQSESSHRDVERSTNQRAEESSPGLFDLASMEANLKTLVKAISAAATGRAPRDQGVEEQAEGEYAEYEEYAEDPNYDPEGEYEYDPEAEDEMDPEAEFEEAEVDPEAQEFEENERKSRKSSEKSKKSGKYEKSKKSEKYEKSEKSSKKSKEKSKDKKSKKKSKNEEL